MKAKQGMRILISGGGTGGHIYPALAIAQEFERRYPDARIHFVGATGRMEMEKIPAAGYSITGLWISGIDRKISARNFLFPFKLISSLVKAYFLIKKFKPQMVVGTGGFASGPLLYIAAQLKIPTLIQEQNSYPGITNKLLSSKVNTICVAHDGLDRFFPENKIVLTGNPVRKGISQHKKDLDKACVHFGLEKNKPTVLILGGSLGAKAINEYILENLKWFQDNDVQLLWQTGSLYYETCAQQAELLNYPGVVVKDFIYQMDLAYGVAHVAISRAGASTLSEMCLAGLPVILVPSPNVAEDHQTKNAQALADKDAAILVKESELPLRLFPALKDLVTNDDKREAMQERIAGLGKPRATEHIVDCIEKLMHG